MTLNPFKLMELKQIRDAFQENHPRFFPFLTAVSKHGVKEGSIVEIHVTTPEGETYKTNLKLSSSDIQALEKLKAQMSR